MTLRPLHELQDVMLRIDVRNVMFLATLPYHLTGEVGATRTLIDLAQVHRPPCANRVRDTRLLR